jgi:hypothetical protein
VLRSPHLGRERGRERERERERERGGEGGIYRGEGGCCREPKKGAPQRAAATASRSHGDSDRSWPTSGRANGSAACRPESPGGDDA